LRRNRWAVLNADVEGSSIVSVPGEWANIDAESVDGGCVGPRASGTGRNASLCGILSELVGRTVDRGDADSSLIVGEVVVRVASVHADPDAASRWDLGI
jgi:hypothetical protein